MSFTAYVTRYALTTGIRQIEAESTDSAARIRDLNDGGYAVHFYKPDWYMTMAAAREQAEKMRLAKIASLQKQIAKLEKLKF